MKSVYAFGLSVCPSVCPRSNSRKYPSNVLKLIYFIHIWHNLNRIENGMYTPNGLSTETHKSFPILYGLRGGDFFRDILMYLNCTKYNAIFIYNSYTQKHFPMENGLNSITVLYTGSLKFSYTLLPMGDFKAHFSIFLLY